VPDDIEMRPHAVKEDDLFAIRCFAFDGQVIVLKHYAASPSSVSFLKVKTGAVTI
jgi:hypothetical protein